MIESGFFMVYIYIMRFFLQLSYDGTSYSGWQKQNNAVSVQETIELAMAKLFQKEHLHSWNSRLRIAALGQEEQEEKDDKNNDEDDNDVVIGVAMQ